MADLILGTRKGLFVLDEAGRIRHHAFIGIPVSAVLFDPRDGALYAGLDHGHFGVKLHRSEDGGASWTELPAPAFPEGTPNLADKPAPSVSLIWILEAAGEDAPGTLWAGTIPGGLFRSDDRGATWHLNSALWGHETRPNWFGGGYDDPGIHSILFDPKDSRRLILGISCGGVWHSDDAGESWRLGGDGLVASYMPETRQGDLSIQDPHRLVACPAAPENLWIQHHCGVFRSTDGGANWAKIEGLPASDFGFAVAVHPRDPDTAWFVPAISDQYRVPVDGRVGVTRTTDGGRSFTLATEGLPDVPAYDLVYRHGLAVASDGAHLAMGSTTGGLWISADGGEAWTQNPARFPPVLCVRYAGDVP
jgi:photosystem II stability/assembly factor-like uncharacterized protein